MNISNDKNLPSISDDSIMQIRDFVQIYLEKSPYGNISTFKIDEVMTDDCCWLKRFVKFYACLALQQFTNNIRFCVCVNKALFIN